MKNRSMAPKKICKTCGLNKDEMDYLDLSRDKPHASCYQCRIVRARDYARKYRERQKNEMKSNPNSMNLDAFIIRSVRAIIVRLGKLQCSRCGFGAEALAIDLLDPHGDVDFKQDIQMYISLPTKEGWTEVIKVVPYLIPICANCKCLSDDGHINILDYEYHYTAQQINDMLSYNN